MAKIKVDKNRCKGCYLCVVNCPNGLIKISGELNIKGVKPAYFSGSKKPARPKSASVGSDGCAGCGMCALICPDGGIIVYKE